MNQVVTLLAGVLLILIIVEIVSRRRTRRVREQSVYHVPHPDSDSEIVDLVRARRKIEAIKRYREDHRVDLRTAKKAIDQLEHRIREQGQGS